MSVRITSASLKIKSCLTSAQVKKIFTVCVKSLKDTPELEGFQRLLGVPKSMELHYCDDIAMRSYQKKFRKLDRTTDVLSFPSLESPANSERHFLGSVIVSLPTVERNSKRYKRSYKKELAEVLVHGILHLLSFDHVRVSLKKKQRMREIQSELSQKVSKLLFK